MGIVMKTKKEKLAEAKEELDEIKGAISRIVGGSQSYRVGSRSAQEADLATLYKRKDLLEERVNALEGGTGGIRRIIPIQ